MVLALISTLSAPLSKNVSPRMTDFDYVLDIISPWIDKYINHGPEVLSSEEVIGVGVLLFEAEVNNGGFDQYYFNSAGDLAIPTVKALLEIGARNTAALLGAANSEFPDSLPPVDRELRQLSLDGIRDTARFGALEEEFYRGKEDLTALLACYYRMQENAG